jgi:hypothetical protein
MGLLHSVRNDNPFKPFPIGVGFRIADIGYFIRIISKLVDRIFYESLARARKERQIAPQASAGYFFS